MIYTGKKTKRPPLDDTIKKAVANISALSNMGRVGPATYGKQALNDWKECLRGTTYQQERSKAIADDHMGIWITVATNYGHAGYTGYTRNFLERAKTALPMQKRR